jgi:xanthine dehydrogenase YagR molybdenum-binding subunit
VEGAFALESALDELAVKLGMDPLDVRLTNHTDINQAKDLPYSSKDLKESYARGADRIVWDRRNGSLEHESGDETKGKARGIGMASQIWGGGASPPSYALMKVNADGSFDLLTGTQDVGTGTKTVMTQIAAEELGVPPDRVRVTIGDTLACPYSLLSAGSLTVPSVGPPVRMAAGKAREQLLDIASIVLDVPVDDLTVEDGTVLSISNSAKKISVDEVAAKIGNYMIIGKGVRGPNPAKHSVNTFGAHFVEVEVNRATGVVKVVKVVAAHEFGRILNPMTLSSQVEGGVIQGLGYGLLETRIMDTRLGRMVNPNLHEYRIPTSQDIPEIECVIVDQVDPIANSIGAKGAGEPPIIPPAAAIANAVYDAVGVRIRELPITPDKILKALEDKA